MMYDAATRQIRVFPSSLGWFALDWREGQLHSLVFGFASGAEAAGVLLAGLSEPENADPAHGAEEVCWVEIPGTAGVANTPPGRGGARSKSDSSAAGREIRRLAERLQAYADGQRDEFTDIPVALDKGTTFQRKVLQQCRRIRYGQTRTYGQLAAQAGSPQAARAVGGVMARNRVPLIIPCHRVIGAAGTLRGYSGCGGAAMKRRLLELEGVL